MRAVIQRVTSAKVTVGDRVVGSINKGICVLLGIGRGDTAAEAEWMVKKLLSLRLWEDEASGKQWNKSVKDIDGQVLLVSQVRWTALALGLGLGPFSSPETCRFLRFLTDFLSQILTLFPCSSSRCLQCSRATSQTTTRQCRRAMPG